MVTLWGESGEYMIKRLIGLPGEQINIVDGHVFVDGTELDEAYVIYKDDFSGAYQIPDDQYFVMGDNRPNSSDSRYWAYSYVPAEEITGKVLCQISPYFRLIKRPDYNI